MEIPMTSFGQLQYSHSILEAQAVIPGGWDSLVTSSGHDNGKCSDAKQDEAKMSSYYAMSIGDQLNQPNFD